MSRTLHPAKHLSNTVPSDASQIERDGDASEWAGQHAMYRRSARRRTRQSRSRSTTSTSRIGEGARSAGRLRLRKGRSGRFSNGSIALPFAVHSRVRRASSGHEYQIGSRRKLRRLLYHGPMRRSINSRTLLATIRTAGRCAPRPILTNCNSPSVRSFSTWSSEAFRILPTCFWVSSSSNGDGMVGGGGLRVPRAACRASAPFFPLRSRPSSEADCLHVGIVRGEFGIFGWSYPYDFCGRSGNQYGK